MPRTAATLPLHAPIEAPRSTAAGPSLAARLLARVSLPAGRPHDARESYLAQAVDHQDLEQRLRAWEAHEQRLRAFTFTGW